MIIGPNPLGIQQFDGLPVRRLLNKAKFYMHRLSRLKQPIFFSAN